MNKQHINRRLKNVAGMAQELFGKLVVSADQQVKGFKSKSTGLATVGRGDEDALADVVLYD
jgi:uncharacterized protein YjbJ (UPF0337 family)